MIIKDIIIKSSGDLEEVLTLINKKYYYKSFQGFFSQQQVCINVNDTEYNSILFILTFKCSFGGYKKLFRDIRAFDIKKQLSNNR